jgi:oligopeptide/dipeptide ABC transporter ATP-binding protein
MYVGKIVEEGLTDGIFAKPLHPYTKALISAIPAPNPKLRKPIHQGNHFFSQ